MFANDVQVLSVFIQFLRILANKNLDKFIRAAFHQSSHITRRAESLRERSDLHRPPPPVNNDRSLKWESGHHFVLCWHRPWETRRLWNHLLHWFQKNLCHIMRAAFKKATLKIRPPLHVSPWEAGCSAGFLAFGGNTQGDLFFIDFSAIPSKYP